jgi:integrase
MANQTVALLLRVSVDGKQPYLKPLVKNGKVCDKWATYKGVNQQFVSGSYAIRYKQRGKLVFKGVGQALDAALMAQRRKEIELEATAVGIQFGVPVTNPNQRSEWPQPPGPKKPRLKLTDARDKYIDDIAARKSWKTADGYKYNVNTFIHACPNVEFMDEIEREHMVRFINFLRDGRGNSARTQRNRVDEFATFMRFFGHELPMPKIHRPKFTEKEVFAYTERELLILLEHAEDDDLLFIQFFLGSGGREQEVQYACWPDLNFDNNTFTVRLKEDLGFTPKDFEERTIPMPTYLMDRLQLHLASNPDERLVFTTDSGGAEGHFLRRLKKIALRAGLNCGWCVNKHGLSCKEHPVCKHWHLHALRKTFATRHHESGVSARTLQAWLGHSDLETTLRYLEAGSCNSDSTRQAVDKSFDHLLRPRPKLVA